MGDSLHRIDDRAGEVVGGVDLPLGTGAVVGSWVAAVDDRVTKGLWSVSVSVCVCVVKYAS